MIHLYIFLSLGILFSCASKETSKQETKFNNLVSNTSGHDFFLGEIKLQSENLIVTKFLNGENIPEAKSKSEWISAFKNKKAAFCFGSKINQFGKKEVLYNYYALLDPRGLISKDKILTELEMSNWLSSWNQQTISDFKNMNSEERNYLGNYYDLDIINWWLFSEDKLDENNVDQAYVIGWNKNGDYASIQLANYANGFYIRCKK